MFLATEYQPKTKLAPIVKLFQLDTRGPAESWRDLFDYFNIDYFKNVLKFQVSQVDSALPTQKK